MADRVTRPKDVDDLRRQLSDEAAGANTRSRSDVGKDPAAVALGRKGGLKGGRARAAALTPEQRSESARRAAQARWDKR